MLKATIDSKNSIEKIQLFRENLNFPMFGYLKLLSSISFLQKLIKEYFEGL